MRVTVGLFRICDMNFSLMQMISSELGTEGRSAHSIAIGPNGSLTPLRNLTLQWDEWAGGRGVQCGFHAALSLGWLPALEPINLIFSSPATYDWHRKRRIIMAVMDAATWCHVSPCRDQLLNSSQFMQNFCTAASHGTLLIVSAKSPGRKYTRGLTYMRVLNFGRFWPSRRVDLYADRLVCAYMWYMYIMYCTVIRGGTSLSHGTMYRKFCEIWFWMPAHRQNKKLSCHRRTHAMLVN